MNIYIISPNPICGGAATANISIARMLAKNHSVYYNDEYNDININGIIYDSYPTHQSKDSKKLIDHLLALNIDVVIWGIAMNLPYYHFATKMIRRLGIKQIVLFHSLAIYNKLKDKIMEYLVASSVKYINQLVFVSQYTNKSWSKYRIIRKHPNKAVVYNPISSIEGRCFPKSSDLKMRIGFVGRFSDEKQPEIFCSLSEYSKDLSFVAFGDGPLISKCKNKYYDKIDFRGHVTDLNEIYSNMDILVMTSKFENCPMVILEARKYGIPCVVPKVGGIPEIVKNGVDGLLYESFSCTEILKCINNIRQKYLNYSDSCLITAKEYLESKLVYQWENLLK